MFIISTLNFTQNKSLITNSFWPEEIYSTFHQKLIKVLNINCGKHWRLIRQFVIRHILQKKYWILRRSRALSPPHLVHYSTSPKQKLSAGKPRNISSLLWFMFNLLRTEVANDLLQRTLHDKYHRQWATLAIAPFVVYAVNRNEPIDVKIKFLFFQSISFVGQNVVRNILQEKNRRKWFQDYKINLCSYRQ